jgi:inward rectifier potassium channel
MTGEENLPEKFAAMKIPIGSDVDRDLGFGEKVARESRLRFLNRDGSFNVRRTGLRWLSTRNLYHLLLTMNWTTFLGLVLLLYFLSNIIFGLLYASMGDGTLIDTSEIPTESIYIRAFFFSVQTFATIGYGTIHPVGIMPNLLVTVESYYSLLVNALITGLVFARFSRPTAKLIFSDFSIISPYRGGKGFMFRLVNSRNSQLIEAKIQVLFTRMVEKDGSLVRKFDLLNLERESVSFMPLSWTVVHPIDENSPMYNLKDEDFVKDDAEILILISAMDETFSQVVHTRSSYKAKEIKCGYKFSNMYNDFKDGEPISIDIRKLSGIEKV